MDYKDGKDREFYTLKAMLIRAGYTKVTDEYIFAVQDWLKFADVDYTMFDWLKDTQENYPHELNQFKEGEDD